LGETAKEADVTTSRSRSRRALGALLVALFASLCALAPSALGGNGADGSSFVLTSFDGTTLTALNDEGHSFIAQFGSTTAFKPAALDKYVPSDPYRAACGVAAANYNGALIVATSDGGVALSSAISSLAALRCKAKVVFQPSDPYNPGDPYVPPNPIKGFQPVP
jgi:hypothetical protein